MSFRLTIIFISTFLMASMAGATDWDEQNQLKELTYPEIERTLQMLRDGPRFAEKCEEPIQHHCSFDSYCRSFTQRDRSIYIYKNEEGRRIPNIPLLGVYNALARCGTGLTYPSLTEDPFLHPEKFLEKKHKAAWAKERPRIDRLYKETKNRLIKVLEAKKTDANKVEIDNLIQRVQTVSLKMPDEEVFSNLAANGCEFPNAFYFPGTHSITLCPQLGNFPDASLMSTLAHELGHAIDPCHCAQDLMKTSKGYVVDFAFDETKFATKNNIEGQKLATGVPLTKNPLSSVISCLQGPTSVGITVPTAQMIKSQMIKEGKQDKNPELVAAGNAVPGLYSKMGACENFSNSGLLTESFSDWVSAEVLADKLQDIPASAKAKQFAFESQAMFLGAKCPGTFAAVQERAAEALGTTGPACGQAFKNYEDFAETSKVHPVSPARMTKIIYAHPALQKALGCKPDKFKECQ